MQFQPGQSGNPSTQFQPGQSGNPAGYPAGVPNRSTVLKKLLALTHRYEDPTTGQEVEGTVEEAMTWGVIQKAMQGDTPAFKEVMDSVYGKVTDKQEVVTTRKITRRIGGRTPPPEDGSAGA